MKKNSGLSRTTLITLTPRRVVMCAVVLACSSCDDTTRPPTEAEVTPEQGPVSRGPFAFVSDRTGLPYIYLANEDGSAVTPLTAGSSPAWSPDGRRLAFHGTFASQGREAGIYAINVDGTGLVRLAPQGGHPVWSPDGSRIAFNSVVNDPVGGIYVMNADGTNATRLIRSSFVSGDDWIGLPEWSPDGRHIAFVRANYEEPWQIYIMNVDGTAPRRLNDGYFFLPSQSEPAWSPDGSQIAYEGHLHIAVVNVDGSGLRRYVQTRAFAPVWSPDARSIVFNMFASPIAEPSSPFGSRMRIFIKTGENGAPTQLIADAVTPARANYRDDQVAWARGNR